MGSTKARFHNGVLEYYDSETHERVDRFAPVKFEDDFLGDAIGALWTVVDVSSAGDTAPLLVADGFNGILRMPLDVTSEAQESGLTWGDQRPLVLNQGLIFEARMRLNVLPTLLSEAVWGLASDKNAVADSVATGLWFKADGGGAIVAETDDGTINNDDVATGITVVADEYAIYRIDCTTPADIHFYINGNRVASGTTFDASTDPDVALQPYLHIAKASGAGLGVLDCDYLRVWQRRSA